MMEHPCCEKYVRTPDICREGFGNFDSVDGKKKIEDTMYAAINSIHTCFRR